MVVKFIKYQALGNDFIVTDCRTVRTSVTNSSNSKLARSICNRTNGVGADGLLVIKKSSKADCKVDIYNQDGSWAEKSGNGLRIAAVYLSTQSKKCKEFTIETASSVNNVKILKESKSGFQVMAELGPPTFIANEVPVNTKQKFVINSEIKIRSTRLAMTCLAVGNPHAVILVEDFNFAWQELGSEIETAPSFPNGTNVEFVKPISRKRIKLAEWERGAGATGSSGTGAAAAVCALVMLGLADRICEVEFENGKLIINWDEKTNMIYLTGPVEFVLSGEFEPK